MINHKKIKSLTFWENKVQPPQGQVWTNRPDRYLLAPHADCVCLYKDMVGRDMDEESCETTHQKTTKNYKAQSCVAQSGAWA